MKAKTAKIAFFLKRAIKIFDFRLFSFLKKKMLYIMNIKKRKLPLTLSIASLIISAACASADTLYWVDAATYFNAASGTIESSGKISNIWNIDRDFSSAEKSKYSDAYNWATGYKINEVKVTSDSGEMTYYVPEYTYASSVTAPNENTDVYFKFTDFSGGSSSVGYRHQIAGSPSLSSDITIKSLTIENANDNWLMFKSYGHDITIKEDLTYSSSAVAYIGSDPKTDIYVGGSVNMHGIGTSMWNALRIGNDGVNSIKIGKDIIFKGNPGRVQLATAGAATTFATPQSVVSGIVDFSGYTSRLDLGRYGKNNGVEQFYAFGGLSGTNFGAKVSTGAETDANGLNSTLVLKNSADAEFAGMVTNPVTADDDNVKPAITTTMNVVMNGSAKQVLSGDNSFNGYIQVESGTLVLRTASGASHGKLTINGGKIGAITNMTVSSAEWNGGAISFINSDEAKANETPETITIEGDFLKSGAGKIMMDFNNFDTIGLGLVDKDIWFDLIYVDGETLGFADDANDNFYAANLDTYADFQWIAGEDGLGKVLQVSFTSVPEPAELAVLIGAIALSMAVFRRRR